MLDGDREIRDSRRILTRRRDYGNFHHRRIVDIDRELCTFLYIYIYIFDHVRMTIADDRELTILDISFRATLRIFKITRKRLCVVRSVPLHGLYSRFIVTDNTATRLFHNFRCYR